MEEAIVILVVVVVVVADDSLHLKRFPGRFPEIWFSYITCAKAFLQISYAVGIYYIVLRRSKRKEK